MPVEHRFFGLDRRTIPLTVVVFALMAVMVWVIPAIEGAVGWDDEVRAGDVIDLGAGVTIVPPIGWELVDGIRTNDEPSGGVSNTQGTAQFGNGGVTVDVVRSGFDGTADDLLDQVDRLRTRSDAEPNRAFKVTGPRETVTTDSGFTGVSQAYTSASGEGRILAFTLGAGTGGGTPTGVTVTIDGTADEYAAQSETIDDLIASLDWEREA